MNFNFELILFYATIITGIVCLFDVLFLQKGRKLKQRDATDTQLPILIDYARSFFPVLLIVFLLRSFLFEPFRIPTGSLEPTLLIGDFVLVNKYAYGVRLPVIHKKLVEVGKPARGDILVFRWPPNPSVDFIKRVIGLPGDHIKYVNKEIYINNVKLPQTFLKESLAQGDGADEWSVQEKREDLLGYNHLIFIDPKKSGQDFDDITVPEGMYFVMGDNRDDSADSRFWGFVPEKNIVGKAMLVWMSFEHHVSSDDGIWKYIPYGHVRWNRIGRMIQ